MGVAAVHGVGGPGVVDHARDGALVVDEPAVHLQEEAGSGEQGGWRAASQPCRQQVRRSGGGREEAAAAAAG